MTLPDRALQLLEHLVVQRGRARDPQLDLAPIRAHEGVEFLADALQHAQPVVLRQRVQEVLDHVDLVRARDLLQFLHDLGFVFGAERRRSEHRGELGVLLERVQDAVQRFGRGFEGGRLCRRRVLVRRGRS